MSKLQYNERSWAIDLISSINQKASKLRGHISRAGGEQTLFSGDGCLFPDVILFGKNSSIAMGWELKLPDTEITDNELIQNAEKKATLLKTNSFLLWNVNIAVMYTRNPSGFSPVKTWSLKGEQATRQTTESRQKDCDELLNEILTDINRFFESGQIVQETIITTFTDGVLTDLISQNTHQIAENLEAVSRTNGRFRAKANLHWSEVQGEYPQQNRWEVLATAILISWSNKFLFSHILKRSFPTIKTDLAEIKENSSPEEVSRLFVEISRRLNFWTVFQPQLGDEHLTDKVWQEFIQIHFLLSFVDFVEMEERLIQKLLEKTAAHSKRKTSGQFSTPRSLARLLTALSVLNRESTIHDPCCGTGTIARAAYDLKMESGISPADAMKGVFASDKTEFPLQLATMALTEIDNIGEILQIYKTDCANIRPGQTIEFRDPNTGRDIPLVYKKMDCFVSNFPFVRHENIDKLNPELREKAQAIISTELDTPLTFDKKSDLYAYLPVILWDALSDHGRLGFIASNSWLATEWGKTFRKILHAFFHIELVLCSSSARWFKNADVVATALILNKRKESGTILEAEKTQFISINNDLNSFSDSEIHKISDAILAGETSSEISSRTYPSQEILNSEFSWNTLFTDVSWLSDVEKNLSPITEFFQITRGERRGWDKMFFPPKETSIEEQYLKPVLKNLRNTKTYRAEPNSLAFCCEKTADQLLSLHHSGALEWIHRFEHSVNTQNKPLPDVLARANHLWHEMKPNSLANLAASINYGNRIFIVKLPQPSFVNQRLTSFTANSDAVDLELTHALLNSIIGLFFIEALGFGRGQGALDLSTARIQKGLKILNPERLSIAQKTQIKTAFHPVASREVMPLLDELEQEDRTNFDQIVLRCFGIQQHYKNIEHSLLWLHRKRYDPQG